jgi:hypothetical protein
MVMLPIQIDRAGAQRTVPATAELVGVAFILRVERSGIAVSFDS